MRLDGIVRLFFAMGLSGLLLFSGCGKQEQGGPPQGGMAEVAVVTVQLERVAITTELAGRTSAYLVAEVRPQVGGIIQKRLFNEGDDVKAGDVLYQIDPATYQAAYAGAKATLAKSEANLKAVRLKASRYKELVAIKAVSRQDCDDAEAALGQAEAEIESNKAALDTARINLDYTRVTAPISGHIGKSAVTVGALVRAGQDAALATIQKLDPVYVDVTQSSANLLRLKQSMAGGLLKRNGADSARVKLILENGAPYPIEGTLKFSDVTVDPATGSFILRSVFPNPKGMLLPGMYVRAVLEEGVNDKAILVPQRCVTRNQKGQAVAMVVDAKNKIEERLLRVERTIGEHWLVGDGLKPGERLVAEGFQKIRPGDAVKAVPFGEGKTGTAPAAPAQKQGR